MPPLAVALVAGGVVVLTAWLLRQHLVPPRRSTDSPATAPTAASRSARAPSPLAFLRRPRPAVGIVLDRRTASRRTRRPVRSMGRRHPAAREPIGIEGEPPVASGDLDEAWLAHPPAVERHPPPHPPRSRRRLRRGPSVGPATRAATSPRRRWSRLRRRPPVEHHLAEWCTCAARSIRSGAALPDAVAQATSDVSALESTFVPVQQAQRRGASLSAALDRVTDDDASVTLVVAVVRTCSRLGGSAAPPLDRAAAVMHARLTALAERRVQSAQAKMSALVMTATPFAVLTLLVSLESSVRASFGLTATWVCLGAGVVLNLIGWWWMRRIIGAAESPRKRPWSRGPTAAQLALPDGVELLVCCLHAGLSPPQLIDAVVADLPSALHPAFDAVRHQLRRGHRFADAIAELPRVIGPDAHSLADSIAAADRYGLPLAPVLERLAAEAVDARRRLGEIAARKLPVRLSFPLVGTVLPAFVLIALAPAVIGAVSTLRIS